jgi:solute carrier family 13 (sodium-dependent dicarboxylate transporter), member 2/3/5
MRNSESKYFFYKKNRKENIGLISGPLLFVIILFIIPFPQSTTLTNKTISSSEKIFSSQLSPKIALGTMAWMVVWWITECVPLGFTSLLAPFIFITSGILTVNQALPKFSDPIIWIFISGFVLAASFKKTGLDKRIAYRLATFYKGNNPKIAIFFIACLPVFLLSTAGSITAATTIVFPFVLAFMSILNIPIESNKTSGFDTKDDKHLIEQNDSNNKKIIKTTSFPYISNANRKESKKNENSKYAEASFLSLGQAATAGAMLLLISTAPNLIAKATVEDFVPGKTISFTNWFIIGFPHAIIGLLISWNIVFLIIRPKVNLISSVKSQFKDNLSKMGKISTEEKAVLLILVLALILWISPSLIRSFYPTENVKVDGNDISSLLLNNFAKNVPESVPALLIILSVGLVKIKRNDIDKEEGERENNNPKTSYHYQPILNWNEMLKAIDWNILFLFGGGLVLGLGIEHSGLASLMGNIIAQSAGSNISAWGIFAISAIMSFMLSYTASNTASAVIMCPIAASLAVGAGFNPIPPIIAAGLAASISSAIPSSTPPMAIIYSSRAVSILNIFKTGIVSDLLRLAILIMLGPLMISLIY